MKSVLVTSGPTRAYFDRVRYIANTSSGALGARIVEELAVREIPVVHIRGVGGEKPVVGNHGQLRSLDIETVDDIVRAVERVATEESLGAVVHAMAVLDYTPEKAVEGKKSSVDDHWDIRLVKTPKVIGRFRTLLPDAVLVGFKLESGISEDELVLRAMALLDHNHLDYVVANLIEHVGPESHEALMVSSGGMVEGRYRTKRDIAAAIADRLAERLM